MNKLKLIRFLFVLAIALSLTFGILLIITDTKDNVVGRIGLWCGLASQLLLAVAMYSELRRIKKGQDNSQ